MILMYGALFVLIAGYVFYTWYPPFGGRSKHDTLLRSPQYTGKIFRNIASTEIASSFSDWTSFFWRQLHDRVDRKPQTPIKIIQPDFTEFLASSQSHIMWLGHSTVLARIEKKTILFDPVFSKRASPFQWIGPKRFNTNKDIQVNDLPPIDAVVISHDHYDHLDYGTIKQLRTKAQHFFVPLGLKAHLLRWEIADDRITELDWWEEKDLGSLTFVCTPAQHFSGRTLTDRAATLWSSWVVKGQKQRLFFSGDGGYGTHFKDIGDAYGPFDITMLECGQYDPLWADIHMTPEQTVSAYSDLRGRHMIPIHWGAFKLALHSWTEPIERARKAAGSNAHTILSPRIGQIVSLPPLPRRHRDAWWQV